MGYLQDNIRQKFAGKERDTETGLDEFGARYYSSAHGRFTSPDPIVISVGRVLNPQIWNAYSYTGNNPLSFGDPTGLERIKLGDSEKEIQAQHKAREAEKDKLIAEKKKTKVEAEKDRLQGLIDGKNKELNTLNIKLQGTRVVQSILKASNPDNLQLSDFELSTDPKNDFKGVLSDGFLAKVDTDTNAFVAKQGNAIQQASIGNRIIIPTNSSNPLNFYVMATSSDLYTRQDARYIGAGVFKHEDYHRKNGDSEYDAYGVELEFLNSVGNKFLKTQNLETRINTINRQLRPDK